MTREEVKAMPADEIRRRMSTLVGLPVTDARLILQWLALEHRAPCIRVHSWALDVWEASGACAGDTVTFEDKDIGVAVMRLYVFLYAP